MVRKWPLAAAISALLAAGSAYALGIGDIEVHSALNERLVAEIRVHSSVPGEVDDLNVRLASPADFAAAGVERAHHLSALKFTVATDRAGRPVVKVTSPEPVKEPYLNFLLEFTWPKGRVLREYTVLLDPPVTMASKPAPAKAAAAAQPSPKPQQPAAQSAPSIPAEKPAAAAPAPAGDDRFPLTSITEPKGKVKPAEAPASFSGDSYGPTTGGDTLWSIANKVKPAGVSTQQMMLALLKANPQAFTGGSIHGLKSGQVLRIPSKEDAAAIPAADAAAQVRQAPPAKPGGSPAVKPEPVTASAAKPAAKPAEEQAKLKIVAPAASAAAASGAASKAEAAAKADVERLQRELTLANETIASQRLENAELKSRVQELEAATREIERLKKLIEVQNADLARLQQKAAETAKPAAEAPSVAAGQKPAEAAKPAPSAAPPAAAEPLVKAQTDAPPAPSATDEKKPAEPEKPVAAKVDQAPPAAAPSTQTAPAAESQPAQPSAAAAQTAQPEAAAPAQEAAKPQEAKPEAPKVAETQPAAKPAETATEQAKPKKPKKTAPPPPPPPEPSLIEEFGGLIGGALAAIVLAVLGFFGFRKWKKGREAQAEPGAAAAGSEADTELSFEEAFGDQDVTDKRQPAGVATTPTLAPTGPVTQREEPARAAPAAEEAAGEDKTQLDLGDIFESAEPETPADAAPATADGDDTPDDIMGEADVYAAFGDYDQAATTMRNAIAGSPGKAMYKLKLLEIYRDAGDKASFQKAYGEFASSLSGRQAARAEEMAKAMGVGAAAGGAFTDTVSALDTQRMSAPPAPSVNSLSDTQEVDFELDMSGANSQTGGHLDTLVMAEAPKAGLAEVADTVEHGGMGLGFADTAVLSHTGGLGPGSGSSDMLPDTIAMGSLPGDSGSAPSLALADTAELSAGSAGFDLDLTSLGTPSLEEAKPGAADDGNLLSFDVDSPAVVMDPAKEARADDAAAPELDMGLDFNLEPSTSGGREPEKAPAADDSTLLLLDDAPADAAPAAAASEELSLGSLALEGDEVATKLDLARAYIDMGDPDAAKDILGEVLSEGNTAQQQEAQKLMSQIGA